MSRQPQLVVIGVSGSGKSTVGIAVAERLGLPFVDGDDLHPPENVAKMAAGRALDDDDRWPWLDLVGKWLADHPDGGVVACSALKRVYRERILGQAPEAEFLHLHGDPALIAARQKGRKGHFMPPSLMSSQLALLEPLQPDEPGLVVDVGGSVPQIVEEYVEHLGR